MSHTAEGVSFKEVLINNTSNPNIKFNGESKLAMGWRHLSLVGEVVDMKVMLTFCSTENSFRMKGRSMIRCLKAYISGMAKAAPREKVINEDTSQNEAFGAQNSAEKDKGPDPTGDEGQRIGENNPLTILPTVDLNEVLSGLNEDRGLWNCMSLNSITCSACALGVFTIQLME
ncbi:hypothetical protein L1987_32476 [Smallanthus sonchifolius]|uniref:Uncharacterized protein n=1 Tax=Smallanthus sonchifolius TaxID=185202 RepID=A0ACB9HPJ7_9ASTR|nr:hypothetical protein L1987_32476 [Smallanthus sonchifolius]